MGFSAPICLAVPIRQALLCPRPRDSASCDSTHCLVVFYEHMSLCGAMARRAIAQPRLSKGSRPGQLLCRKKLSSASRSISRINKGSIYQCYSRNYVYSLAYILFRGRSPTSSLHFWVSFTGRRYSTSTCASPLGSTRFWSSIRAGSFRTRTALSVAAWGWDGSWFLQHRNWSQGELYRNNFPRRNSTAKSNHVTPESLD